MPDDEVKEMADARLGRVLRGKYRLDRVLGIGGMATVYAATHRNKKRFAIKMLHPELSVRENIRTRFLREGYVANSVDHAGAVAVLDDDVAEDGSAFVVMEYLDGAPVDQVAARHDGPVPLGLAVSIGDALLDVLAAAHAKGVIHRDIKPANLFLTTDGRLEVLDFGIARLHDETGTGATQTGAMLGTPAYMAPEQARAESSKVDGQTDLWAAGATLFVLLTGQLVHEGENASQLLIAAGTRPARKIRSLAPDVPKAIAEVIDKALAFQKPERWASAKEMREALQNACVEATGMPVAVLPKTPRAESVTGLEETIASSKDVAPGESGVGFDPTVNAVAPAGETPVGTAPTVPGDVAMIAAATTTAGVTGTKPELVPAPVTKPRRARIGVAIVSVGILIGGGALAVRMLGGNRAAQRRAEEASQPAPNSGSAQSTPAETPAQSARAGEPKASTLNADAGPLVAECGKEKKPDCDGVAWCDTSDRVVACCAPGLAAVDVDGTCACPPGGYKGDAGGTGCPVSTNDDQKAFIGTVEQTIRAARGEIRRCWDNLASKREQSGAMVVDLSLSPGGEVFHARIKNGRIASASVQKCILSMLHTTRFKPPPGGTFELEIPFEFYNQ
ncbi:MAG: protein kinase domain-containing protein [Polyangiaceae bacterium]